MAVHGLRPEFQPENINAKTKEAKEANVKADKPVRGQEDVVPPPVIKTERLLDKKA